MKHWKIGFALVVLTTIIFCLVPYLYQGITGRFDTDWPAWWSFGTFLVAVMAALLAWAEYRTHEDESWEQVRPYVHVSYHFDQHFLFVSVANVGKTAANTVRISFEPQLSAPKSQQDPSSIAPELFQKGLVERPISMIAPGARFLFLIDGSNEVLDHIKDGSLPSVTTASISYNDLRDRTYHEHYCLDLSDWQYSAADYDPLSEIEEEIKLIRKNGLKLL
ncbi:hypothetical protein [Bifidobacterium callitrichidarum]|uniref:hypothetical protein n=1 Tax=Bifidobacterium callitrichidarum TaxID=2052941 RepID=UPI0011B2446A|nr:hypothetical protein [Bifidobacterium callitrichidarum]